MSDERFFMLRNVRISFPHLFEPPVINGEIGKPGATLLLDETEHAEDIKRIKAHLDELAKAKFKKTLTGDKLCLRPGEEKREEYAGYYALSANSKTPIVVLDARKNLITNPNKSPIYAGCRVNAKVSFWAQDNNFGRRVNGNLVAVQFAGDDAPLDASFVSVDQAMDGFDEFDAAVGDDLLD